MANIKSAKKRVLVSQVRADRNKAIRSEVKTSIKKVRAAIDAKDKAAAEAALLDATSTIDKACNDFKEAYPALVWKDGKLLNDATDDDISDFVR